MVVNVCVAINPALKSGLNPSRHAQRVQVWSNKGDTAVVLGKWLSWLNPWATDARPWGEQGRIGYQGNDESVVNFYSDKGFAVEAEGHSAVFHDPENKFFLKAIALYCHKVKGAE